MKYTYKQILLINLPVLMSILVEQLINITDAIFLGHVGETELGASAIASIYYLALYMLGLGFSIGLQVVIARKNGEHKYNETGRIFFQGLYFLIMLGLTLFILSRITAPYIIHKLIASDEVYLAVMKYIDWRCIGLFFAFPFLAFRSFFVGIIKTRILAISSITMVLTNIALNYFLIFGIGGLPALGISGAAIASTASEAVSFIIIVAYTYLYINKEKYGLKAFYDGKTLVKIFRVAGWSMFQSFISVAPWFLFFIAIEHLGKQQLATANIIRSISTLFFVIVNSFAITTGSLVSNLIGAGRSCDIMALCFKIIRLAYIIGIPLLILAFLLQKQILGIYTSNQTLIQGAYHTYIVMLLNYFLAVPAYIYSNAISGIGKTKQAFIFQIVTIAIYLGYLSIISHLADIPLSIYWMAEFLFVAVLFLLSFIYLRNTNRCSSL